MNENEDIHKLEGLAKRIRKDILKLIYQTKSPHIGSCFSMVELLVALYFKILRINPKNPQDPNRDRFLLSKGHGVPALYLVLAERGFIKKETLEGFARDGGILEQHPTRNVSQGIEISSGSLGHGLALGCGMALAGKMDNKDYRVYCIMGDGELQEGQVWEAAMTSAHYKLDNIIAILDNNNLQIDGFNDDVKSLWFKI